MATVKVIDLIDRAETVLQDTTNTRWAQAELLGYLNDAQREIVMQRPDAKVTNATCSSPAAWDTSGLTPSSKFSLQVISADLIKSSSSIT